MLQRNGFRPENDHCDLPMPELLLVLDAPIRCEQNIELRLLSSLEQVPVFESTEPGNSSLFDIHVQVGDFEDDEEDTRRGESSFNLSDERDLGVFERTNGSLARYGREILQELIERFSAFEVIQKRLKRNASAAKHGGSAEDLRILDDDAVHRAHTVPLWT